MAHNAIDYFWAGVITVLLVQNLILLIHMLWIGAKRLYRKLRYKYQWWYVLRQDRKRGKEIEELLSSNKNRGGSI